MMRTFEQRKAEIRRRSEKRIAKRRRNIKRLTGAALSLLCVITAVTLWPKAQDEIAVNESAKNTASGIPEEICEPAGGENFSAGAMPETYREEFTSLEAEEVGLKITQIDTDADMLTVALSNYTDQYLTYGSGYDIERETEDGWVSCAVEEMGWDTALYILEPEDTVTQECWVGGFDLSEPGTYRFVKFCNLYMEEDSTPCRVVAKFTVEEAE